VDLPAFLATLNAGGVLITAVWLTFALRRNAELQRRCTAVADRIGWSGTLAAISILWLPVAVWVAVFGEPQAREPEQG
jgi:hypothetical protein